MGGPNAARYHSGLSLLMHVFQNRQSLVVDVPSADQSIPLESVWIVDAVDERGGWRDGRKF